MCAFVKGRSGLAFNKSVIAFEGLIDSDYRGEIKVRLFNLSENMHLLENQNNVIYM